MANNEEQNRELLDSQGHIWNHIFSFINSMTLKVAVQMNIPDIVHKHGRPMPLSELVSALAINPSKSPCIHRLMRMLVQTGIFIKQKGSQGGEEEESYLLAPASRLLLKDEPLSVAPFLQAMLDPILMTPWHSVAEWFQNGDLTPFNTAHGRSCWEYAATEPKLNKFFNDAMACDAGLVMGVVFKDCRGVFEGLRSFVDVGGGTGLVAKAIADEFPEMDCTVFDQQYVIGDLKGTKNLKYVVGNMFESVPPADAVLLKWVLHDWSDEECVKILKKCKEAITDKGKRGKVIIIDMIVGNQTEVHKSLETQLFFDMHMMALDTGKERTEKEWAKIVFDAGFSDYKITPVLGLRSLIEVFP